MKQLYSTALAALLTTSVSVGAMAAAQVAPAPARPAPAAPAPAHAPSSSTIGNDMILSLTTPAEQPQSTIGSDMIVPLTTPAEQPQSTIGNDMIVPLTTPPKKPITRKPKPVPRDTDYQQFQEIEEKQKKEPRKTIMVRKIRIDPCGDFVVSWGGRKTCQPREIAYWELHYDDGAREPVDTQTADRTPSSSAPRPSGFPMPSSGSNPSATSGGGSAPGGSTGGGNTGAGGGGSAGTGAIGGGPSTGAAGSVAGSTPVDAAGFRPVGQFGARIDSVRIDGDHLDVRVTLRADPGATRLVGNGDWFADAADADGVGMESTALWRPTDGKPQPFDLTPRIPGGQTAQVRFMIPLEAGHAGIARVSIRDLSGNVATFDLPGRSDLAATTAAVERAQVAPVTIGDFAVTIDRVSSWVDQKAELVFSARNLSKQRRFLGGTRLVFRARRQNGDMIEATGRTYLARGKLSRAVEMAAVEAGATAQMRMIFDTPAIIGPVNVSDGTTWVTATMPPAVEPAW